MGEPGRSRSRDPDHDRGHGRRAAPRTAARRRLRPGPGGRSRAGDAALDRRLLREVRHRHRKHAARARAGLDDARHRRDPPQGRRGRVVLSPGWPRSTGLRLPGRGRSSSARTTTCGTRLSVRLDPAPRRWWPRSSWLGTVVGSVRERLGALHLRPPVHRARVRRIHAGRPARAAAPRAGRIRRLGRRAAVAVLAVPARRKPARPRLPARAAAARRPHGPPGTPLAARGLTGARGGLRADPRCGHEARPRGCCGRCVRTPLGGA